MNNMKVMIKLNTPQDVKDFCFAASSVPRNVEAIVSQGRQAVRANSILGLFSLNLSEVVPLDIESVNDIDVEHFKELFAKWTVDNNEE